MDICNGSQLASAAEASAAVTMVTANTDAETRGRAPVLVGHPMFSTRSIFAALWSAAARRRFSSEFLRLSAGAAAQTRDAKQSGDLPPHSKFYSSPGLPDRRTGMISFILSSPGT